MDLFERYLHAVRGFLPKRQQDDVIRELREELHSQVEEREAELGRPLNQSEQEQVLKQLGHPLLLASRYQPQRQLIGPAVFPIYWRVLKIALGVAVLVHVVSAVVFLALGRPLHDVFVGLARLPLGPLLIVFAWVTIVFALLGHSLPRVPYLSNWNPNSLPPVPRAAKTASLASRISEVVVTALGLLWLAAVAKNQWLMFGPAAAFIQLGPPWFVVYLPWLALAGVSLAGMLVTLVRPDRTRLRLVTRIISNVGSLVILVYLLKADDLIVAAVADSASAESLADLLTRIGRGCVGVGTLFVLIEALRDIGRLSILLVGGVSEREAHGGAGPRAS